MGRQKHAAEEIINKLEEADVSSGGGCRLKKRCDISGLLMDRATNGGKEYRGLRTDQATRLKMPEQENNRLQKVVTDPLTDNAFQAAQGHLKAYIVPRN